MAAAAAVMWVLRQICDLCQQQNGIDLIGWVGECGVRNGPSGGRRRVGVEGANWGIFLDV